LNYTRVGPGPASGVYPPAFVMLIGLETELGGRERCPCGR